MPATTTTEVTHLTAPNQTVEASNGVSYAYRRFGNPARDAPPLVFLRRILAHGPRFLSGRGGRQHSQQERNGEMRERNWRELDYRQSEGGRLRVRLLWNQRSHSLAIEVIDHGVERVLALQDPSLARNAFIHPFAYMR